MTLFDEDHLIGSSGATPEPPIVPEVAPPTAWAHSVPPPVADTTSRDDRPQRTLPADLQISWSWVHLLVFLFFGFASLVGGQLAVIFVLSAHRHLTQSQIQAYGSNPQFLVTTNLLLDALLFLFLYVTVAVLPGAPFWRSLGWRPLNPDPNVAKRNPWLFFLSGGGLAIFVALASSQIKDAEHAPIQEFFKHRNSALLMMSMAVFVAPLVEETIFRGYLYPLFAKKLGISLSIVITGVLFGLLHGAQLGWSWLLVGVLTLVGIIFTTVRARTGTVFASFLLHLGYNSAIAITSIIATKGFQQMPPGS
ncbi:MAG: hypothetical protein NVS9B4_27710 [Candidatus Acidiferrum sp.]